MNSLQFWSSLFFSPRYRKIPVASLLVIGDVKIQVSTLKVVPFGKNVRSSGNFNRKVSFWKWRRYIWGCDISNQCNFSVLITWLYWFFNNFHFWSPIYLPRTQTEKKIEELIWPRDSVPKTTYTDLIYHNPDIQQITELYNSKPFKSYKEFARCSVSYCILSTVAIPISKSLSIDLTMWQS